MSSIEDTLAERGARYGSFKDHARIAQGLQDVMRAQAGWQALAPDQKQALTVIADKVARMLNGDPNYRDNWHDIVGYAKLIDDRLLADEERAALGPELPLEETRGYAKPREEQEPLSDDVKEALAAARAQGSRVERVERVERVTNTGGWSGGFLGRQAERTVGIPRDEDYGFAGGHRRS